MVKITAMTALIGVIMLLLLSFVDLADNLSGKDRDFSIATINAKTNHRIAVTVLTVIAIFVWMLCDIFQFK